MKKWEKILRAILNECPDETSIHITQNDKTCKIKKISYIQYDNDSAVIMINIEDEQPE